MRRRNPRTKPPETVKKSESQFGFRFTHPSTSRPNSDLKHRRKVTFEDVEDHRSPLEEAQAGQSFDAKTSEFAFFKKLKSGFNISSDFSNSNKSSVTSSVKQNPKNFESRVKPQDLEPEFAVKDRETKDRCDGYSFSTPTHNHTTRGRSWDSSTSHANFTQTDKENSSSRFGRDKETVQSRGMDDEKGDIFSVKRKKLNQYVKDTWSQEITQGQDLVSLLLTRLFPGAKDTHHYSRFPKDRTDRVSRGTFLDSPRSKFLKRSSSHDESYRYGDYTPLQMENGKERSISWQGWFDKSITPSLQFPPGHHPEDISFAISHPMGSLYEPPYLKQRASLTLESCSPISSFRFSNYNKPLSLGYHHREESGYIPEDLSDREEPASALLLEWNTETETMREETDALPLAYHTELITYPNALSADYPWSPDYSSSHDLFLF